MQVRRTALASGSNTRCRRSFLEEHAMTLFSWKQIAATRRLESRGLRLTPAMRTAADRRQTGLLTQHGHALSYRSV